MYGFVFIAPVSARPPSPADSAEADAAEGAAGAAGAVVDGAGVAVAEGTKRSPARTAAAAAAT
jgi:hypothetical protein